MGHTYSSPESFFGPESDASSTLTQCTTFADRDGTESKACTRFRCVKLRGPLDMPVFGDADFDNARDVTAVACSELGPNVEARIAAAEASGALREVREEGTLPKSQYEYVTDVYAVGTH
jgi:hypothetical protein